MRIIESKLFPILSAYAVLLALGLSISACAKKPKPESHLEMAVVTLDSTPPPRVFVPREKDSLPVLPPRFFAQVFFAFDSDILTKASQETLQRAGGFLFEHPGYSLQVHGYADTVGRGGYNDSLSQRRADRAWSAITAVASPRMGTSRGHGETRGPSDRARRVTIIVLP